MKRWLLIFLLLPHIALASVAGVDDMNTNLTPQQQDSLDTSLTTYYQDKDPKKIETVLDEMTGTELLRKRTSWAPLIGFFTVVFADNKGHLFDWMSRNDYNNYAQNVWVTALLHAGLKETALVFAQAHQWRGYRLNEIRNANDKVDLKSLPVSVPAHVDTLWGAFFGSGDTVYINEIITALLQKSLPESVAVNGKYPKDVLLRETAKRADATLRQYAPYHPLVRKTLAARIASEKDPNDKKVLRAILRSAGKEKK